MFGSTHGNGLIRFYYKVFGIPSTGTRLVARNTTKIISAHLRATDKILDAGCGSGLYSNWLAKKGFSIDAIDIDLQMLQLANQFSKRNKLSVCYTKEDVTNMLNFKPESYDCVLCMDVIEHIKDDSKALSEINRVLKKDGLLFLATSTKNGIYNNDHKRVGYDFYEISSKLRNAGFAMIEWTYHGKRVYKLVRRFEDLFPYKPAKFFLFPFTYLITFLDEVFGGKPSEVFIVAKKSDKNFICGTFKKDRNIYPCALI
jgi:ubiquinone/menaquinone biosynthesis C-methylase UbiE